MDDVFDILYPVNSHITPDLHPRGPTNLFTAYVSLDPVMVANHSVFCHTWLSHVPYIGQNFSFTYTFLKNNTEDTLWAKCLVDYEKYPPAARGGPLMLSILLSRIVQTTQTALDFLVTKLTHLKISTIEGENVETVATMVEAVIRLLHQASRADKARLPSDFPKTLLKLYQTTSVQAFNDTFARHYQLALEQQDLHGGNACWPDLSEINTLAKNAYQRLNSENAWNVPSAAKALVAQRRSCKKKGKGRNSRPSAYTATAPGPPTQSCWNCGPHHSKDCPNPPNKTQAARNARHSQGQRPHTKTAKDGKPLILNKQGNYVLDKSKFKKQTLAEVEDEIMTVFSQQQPLPNDDPGMAPPASFVSVLSGATRTVVAPTSPTPDHVAARAAQTRAMVSATLRKLGKF
jgi:hypothetical protein